MLNTLINKNSEALIGYSIAGKIQFSKVGQLDY